MNNYISFTPLCSKQQRRGFVIVIIISYFLYVGIGSAFAHSLKYDLRYQNDLTEPCLQISLESQTDRTGEMLLRLPLGNKEPIVFSDKKGLSVIQTDDPLMVKIKTYPNKDIRVDYQFCLNNPYKMVDWPLIENNFFLFELSKVLAIPENNSDLWQITLNLEGMPENFRIASSFSMDSKQISVEKNLEQLRKSILIGGDHIQPIKVMVKNNPVWIIQQGRIQGLERPAADLQKLITIQRNFWEDHAFPHYLIVLMEQACDGIVSGSNGRPYENAIVMQSPFCEKKMTSSHQVKWSLSHELFHTWLGKKMEFVQPIEPLMWFIEGFNDYYGLMLAYKGGLINLSEYLKEYNFFIQHYYMNPIHYSSNQELFKDFSKDFHYRILAQFRGHFVARELSLKLTKKNQSLDIIMHKIYSSYLETKKPVHESDILAVFKEFLDEDDWKDFNNKIQQGMPITFSDHAMGTFTQLVNREVEVPDFGFDVKALIETQTIQKLDPNSPEFKAGLREGLLITSHNVSLINPNKEMFLWSTDEAGQTQEFHFFPKKKKHLFPQYMINDPHRIH